MKVFSNRADDLYSLYLDSLKKALDMDLNIASDPAPAPETASDGQLADEFWSYLRQSEYHVARIECLLRRTGSHASA